MKLPDKLPTNLQEAKTMFTELYDQVVEKVTEICNKAGKPADQGEKKAENAASAPEVKPSEAPKPATPTEEKKDSEHPSA